MWPVESPGDPALQKGGSEVILHKLPALDLYTLQLSNYESIY